MKSLGRAGCRLGLGLALPGLVPGAALAAGPVDWEWKFQPAVTPVMARITGFFDLLTVIMALICLFVVGLLVYVVWRFREGRHPVPSRTSHNTVLEVTWTVVPVLILLLIAIPSFRLLFYAGDIPKKTDLVVQVTGHQWYWTYGFPGHGGLTFDSVLVPTDQLKPGQKRLLTVDNPLVLPVGATVRFDITSTDVIHSWAVPPFGIKTDAVPGRLNETWARITKTGTYYGQCSELCGINHGFMPIEVRVVSPQAFQEWLVKAKKEFAANGAARNAPLLASR